MLVSGRVVGFAFLKTGSHFGSREVSWSSRVQIDLVRLRWTTMAVVATLSAMITLAVHSQQLPDPSFELSELLDRRPETYKASSWDLDHAPYLFKEGQAVVEPSALATVTVPVDTTLYPPPARDLSEEIVWKGAPFTASVVSLVNPALISARSYTKPAKVSLGVGEVDSSCSSTKRTPEASEMFGTRSDSYSTRMRAFLVCEVDIGCYFQNWPDWLQLWKVSAFIYEGIRIRKSNSRCHLHCLGEVWYCCWKREFVDQTGWDCDNCRLFST